MAQPYFDTVGYHNVGFGEAQVNGIYAQYEDLPSQFCLFEASNEFAVCTQQPQ